MYVEIGQMGFRMDAGVSNHRTKAVLHSSNYLILKKSTLPDNYTIPTLEINGGMKQKSR